MRRSPLIGVSIVVVCMIVLASFTNVVGVQTVQSMNQKSIKNTIDQRELLFQVIVDLANNKEIQEIVQKYEMRRNFENPFQMLGSQPLLNSARMHLGMIPHPPPVITKKYVEYAYRMGVILTHSRVFDGSKMHSLLERLQINSEELQKEITTVIEKNAILKGETIQLSNVQCDCENDNTTQRRFPVLCLILCPIFVFVFEMWLIITLGLHYYAYYLEILFVILLNIGEKLNCFWYGS